MVFAGMRLGCNFAFRNGAMEIYRPNCFVDSVYGWFITESQLSPVNSIIIPYISDLPPAGIARRRVRRMPAAVCGFRCIPWISLQRIPVRWKKVSYIKISILEFWLWGRCASVKKCTFILNPFLKFLKGNVKNVLVKKKRITFAAIVIQ